MRNPKLVTLAISAAALGGAVLAAPAASAQDTTVTFSVAGDGLSLATAAATAALGEVTASALGATADGALPKVTVTDNRAGTTGWSSKVNSNGFYVASDTTKAIVIAPAKAKVYVPAAPVVESGTVVATAGTYLTATSGLALSTTATTLVSTTSLTGSNKVSYVPNVAVTIDSTVLANTYEGVITHTVS